MTRPALALILATATLAFAAGGSALATIEPATAATTALGGEVGNGGDAVFCERSAANSHSGYYSLDYLLSYRTANQNKDIADVASWGQSQNRIYTILERNRSDLLRSFERFSSDLSNHEDYLRGHIWLEAGYGLIELSDEAVIRRIPENCRKAGSHENSINLIQAVVRQKRQDITVFHYDTQILSLLREQRPLQHSFLLVHEWLWDFTSDPQILMEANRFLHSKKAEEVKPEEFRTILRNIGLNVSQMEFVSPCHRSPAIRAILETKFSKSCDAISAKHFETTGPLHAIEIKDEKNLELRNGDFSAMGYTKWVKIQNSGLEHLFSDLFSPLFSLEILDLKRNRITDLPEGIFNNLAQLILLNLGSNKIQSVSANLLKNNRRLHAFLIDHNELTEIPSGFLEPLKGMHFNSDGLIDFSHNQIGSLPAGLFRPLCETTYKSLDLSFNKLQSLPEKFFECPQHSRRFPISVYLRNNLFSKEEIKRIEAENERNGSVMLRF